MERTMLPERRGGASGNLFRNGRSRQILTQERVEEDRGKEEDARVEMGGLLGEEPGRGLV
jgi:hypothetical protein